MPISVDEFNSHGTDTRTTNAERVLRFLVHNRDKAYKALEISQSTGVSENSIHPVLNRLKSRDLVRHKAPYWTLGNRDVVRDAFVFHSAANGLDEELGPESREEWLTAAKERSE